MLPLQAQFINNVGDLTGSILNAASAHLSSLTEVGRGIASIFILIIIFVYAANIIEGGKFQAKMLYPVLIYLLTCNFSVVQGIVKPFVTTLQASCVSALSSSYSSGLNELGGGTASNSVFEAFVNRSKKDAENDPLDNAAKNIKSADEEIGEAFSNDEDAKNSKKKWYSKLGSWIMQIPDWLLNKVRKVFHNSMTYWFNGSGDDLWNAYMKNGLWFLVLYVVDMILTFAAFAMKVLGAVMIAILFVFGPITWAFAILPGNQKVIMTWLTRLCQFALYSPIVMLLQAFSVYVANFLLAQSGANAIIAYIVACVAILTAMTSVPSIASMIIEGASGAVNALSSGMQIMTKTVTAPLAAAKGIQDVGSGWEAGRDRKDQDIQKQILSAIQNNNNGAPSGQNPRK